jgi:signal transduction histidine kinase
MGLFSQLLTVRVSDPDDARRRWVLNILLFGVAVIALVAISLVASTATTMEETDTLIYGSIATLIGTVLIYIINRFRSGRFASHLFLILLVTVMAFSDDPFQVSTGRALFAFTIPIVMASMLLGPPASLIYALISTMVITGIAFSIHVPPNTPAILGFFLIAGVSWLSARSLEQALKELRIINRDLDQRVAERTMDLSKSLARERAEAGRNQAILASIADGVLVLDHLDCVLITNRTFEQLIHIPNEELVGLSLNALFDQTGISETDCYQLISTIRNPEQQHANLRIVWGASTFSVTTAQVNDTSGIQIGKVAVFHDFTHEAEVEKLKNSFVATVSHELRTPLNAILGYSEMLKSASFGPLAEKQSNVMDRILSNTRRLLEIVNEILNQAQVEAGRMQIQTKPFKTQEILLELHNVMDLIAQKKGLNLVCDVDPGVPSTLKGDPDRIHQILVNLTTNAVKFTDQGDVRVHLFTPDPTHWAFEVSDHGIGISKKAQEYIFDPFRQADDTATRTYGGIGLGLSIVKKLVNYMGGEIHLVSEPGQGTIITITLPLQPEEKGYAV